MLIFNNCIRIPVRIFFSFSQLFDFKHEFFDKASYQSLGIFAGTLTMIPWATFFMNNQDNMLLQQTLSYICGGFSAFFATAFVYFIHFQNLGKRQIQEFRCALNWVYLSLSTDWDIVYFGLKKNTLFCEELYICTRWYNISHHSYKFWNTGTQFIRDGSGIIIRICWNEKIQIIREFSDDYAQITTKESNTEFVPRFQRTFCPVHCQRILGKIKFCKKCLSKMLLMCIFLCRCFSTV